MNNINYKNHNLIVLKETVDNIRNYANKNQSLKELLFSPHIKNPNAQPNIEFILDEKKDVSHSIYALFNLDSKNKNNLIPTIVFDIDVNKPIMQVMHQDYNEYVHNIQEYKKNVIDFHEKMKYSKDYDEIMERGFNNAIKTANNIEKELSINKRPIFTSNQEKDILTFIISHELAHLSFKERNSINWKLINSNSKLSEEDKINLNSAIYTINRHPDKKQHNGANYLSTRDEIHSDITGLFMLAYIKIKENQFNENEYKALVENLGKARKINNISGDLNNASTHASELVFEKSNVQKIIEAAKNHNINNQTNIYKDILGLTENIFLDTLKKNGITLETNIITNNETVKQLKTTPNSLVINSYYQNTIENNKISGQRFNSCVLEVAPAYKNNCKAYLNGNQTIMVDTNNDNIIDFKKIETALENYKKTTKNTEEHQIINEAIILEKFSKDNNIKIKATDNLGIDSIDLINRKMNFK